MTKNQLILPALKSRNYRLFFAGQGISLIGTWMTQLATVWLVYSLTNSALMLGVVGFTSQIPSFFLAPFGGVFVDRFSRYRTLIGTQIMAMIQSLALAVLALTGVIQVWHIIALSLFQGFINALDAPARQAFVPELVEKREDLANAIAINSTMINGARLIGPAVGGLIIARIGAAYCFLIDGLSYIAVIAALLAMTVKPWKVTVSHGNALQKVKEGFVYAFSFPPIRAILLLSTLVSLMGLQNTILVPIFAEEILKGGAEALGFLMAASGVGALSGGIYLATRRTILGIGKLIAIAPAILGVGLIAFACSRYLPLSLFTMLFVGLGTILQIAASNTFLQTIVEEDKRGRLMSLYTMSFLGMIPVGNLLGGFLASRIGAPNTLILDGIACIIGSILFFKQLPALKKLVIPIYEEKGIVKPLGAAR
ncbi:MULTISPECIES: MFS transporter [unclassified Tolypothrix]|uniref:MFS transporter n=1 Tax=unclassified Tolypothrix TaxID=2649714 RepID=UPI0005EAA465|nr:MULTISPECIES: MFS transporter [unclassified Tolypothrix]BAY90080.1 major facilitator transporter [Microchaete diplosiphon NIES-3275]EKE97434.1 transporter, major facilitator family protein [Tolypothrix sp. PCC 7601]MBE9084999.1 MFS transporter [Tolypothrix sp. LEGE 11397]UYD24301.1 MFS transporter [Tolypothrix sp. PCC 7712]UYD33468.1 MFS transporter [Tolypothrix sp. PCC 7601]